jgi:CRISPR system Cascade subunit CasA
MTDGFSLIDEPWIRVRPASGQVTDLSLVEVIAEAKQIRGLAGEIPTQDVALLRLIVALVYAATRPARRRTQSESLDLWEQWWSGESLPSAEIANYLDKHRDRFFLFHSRFPFLQVADLHTESGKASGLTKLIADVPAGHQYFTTRGGVELESMSYAEAARWLVHCHAFDIGGIKTGAVGDSRVSGGRGYPMGYPAFAGTLGVVMVEGDNLFETILLNCPLSLAQDSDDRPAWERELTAAVDAQHPVPRGPSDLLTWPSRRVRLFPRDGRVVDVQISNGDPLGPQDQFRNEPMASWRKSPGQSKKFGRDVYMPVTHSPGRRVWQGLEPLLVSVEGVSRRAEVLDWLAVLQSAEIVSPDKKIGLRTVGLEYGPQVSSIAGAIDDALHAGVAALTDPVLVQAAVDGAARAKQGVVALVNLASNLAQAAGGESERPRERTFEHGYALLDRPYRQWVESLNRASTMSARLDEWGDQARRILLAAGRELISQAGPEAVVGRDVPKLGSETTQRVDAGLAEIWFRSALKKALVGSAPKQEIQETPS